MKFAYVVNIKTEATKGAKGICPYCGSELIARCGEVKVNHWAHKGNRNCDPWWENETEWHRWWKGQFPVEWQEVVHRDKSGEKHIADVKTKEEWAVEFQHSYLKPEERRARNAFYQKLVWVVDGLRRERDKPQFSNHILKGACIKISRNIKVYQIKSPKESRLLNEWNNSKVLVFFDFQESKNLDKMKLWLLLPKISNDKAFLIPFPGRQFVELHLKHGFNEMAYELTHTLIDVLKRYGQETNQIRFPNRYRKGYRRRF